MSSGTGLRPPPSGKRHDSLKSWAACHELALALYRATAEWPASERYALTEQVRRAAISAAANIAEGASVRGRRQFRRYLDIAVGSLAELSYYLLLARDLGYLPRERWGELEALRDHAGRLTWGLYASLSKASADH
jgi:four helix bundle protein